MIDLYSGPTLNSSRAKIMLDECALPYRLHKVDAAKGDTKRPEFRTMNPFGHVPVIIDDDGPDGRPSLRRHERWLAKKQASTEYANHAGVGFDLRPSDMSLTFRPLVRRE